MKTELIITTYNKPRHLEVVLRSILGQSSTPDFICIADDGSGAETREIIQRFAQENSNLNVRHEWHDDVGFTKNEILNHCIKTSPAEHLVFIDDDCLMHPKFIARHVALAHPKYFMAGSIVRLDEDCTNKILTNIEISWKDGGALENWSPKSRSEWLKSGALPTSIGALLDRVSPVTKNWAGGNASAFKKALLDVNGFDERMKYGGEDKELGVRLKNNGLRGRHLRYTAPLYHLDHGRSYVDLDQKAKNKAMISERKRSGETWTEFGIQK